MDRPCIPNEPQWQATVGTNKVMGRVPEDKGTHQLTRIERTICRQGHFDNVELKLQAGSPTRCNDCILYMRKLQYARSMQRPALTLAWREKQPSNHRSNISECIPSNTANNGTCLHHPTNPPRSCRERMRPALPEGALLGVLGGAFSQSRTSRAGRRLDPQIWAGRSSDGQLASNVGI